MPATNEPRQSEVRVFISSTFRDMHAERDHLVTVVFPELRERVEKLGLDFFDVDLRWGVPEKNADGKKANSWEYCRQWIDRVEPFFVCILGQRYGWVPAAGDFKSDEDKLRQESEPRSITDLEVRHAVLDDRKKRRSHFYLRETEAPATVPEYVDPPPLSGKLEQLKNEVRSCGRPVRDYPCEWTGSGFTGMDEFGRRVLEDLWSGVLRDERYVSKDVWRQVLGTDPDADPRYTDESEPVPRELWENIVSRAKPEPRDPLDAEREQMAAFATARLRWFQGRTEELETLMTFIRAKDENAARLAVIAAQPGQGKSALLAKLSTLISEASDVLITHFVGATEHSSSAHALVERLLGELDRSGIRWPEDRPEDGQEPKRDFNSLCLRLAERQRDYAGERRIVILVDALNQLSDGHDLQWLPTRLGPRVRVIVSCVDDATAKVDGPEQRVMRALAARQPASLHITLWPLTEVDVRTIVIAYLKEYCHELDHEHLDTLCAIPQARNPLYLLVMLNELRTLGGNDLNRIIPARIAAMPHDYPDTVSLFRWVLQRLEEGFGVDAVRWWCLYLAHGRVGMASREQADLLARRLGGDAAATALRIERGLRRYLQRRGGQLDYFHSQLRQAVFEQYQPRAGKSVVHDDIAAYFLQQDNFRESVREQRARALRLPPTVRHVNGRKAEELVYQLLNALYPIPRATQAFDKACGELESSLTDLFFLEAKVEAGLVFELAGDISAAVDVIPENRPHRNILRLLGEVLRRDINFIAKHPTTLFQCIWNFYALRPDAPSSGSNRGRPCASRANDDLNEILLEWLSLKSKTQTNAIWVCSHLPASRNAEHSGLTFRGITGQITSIAYSDPARRIAASSDHGKIWIWDSTTAEQMMVLDARQGPDGAVSSIAFSPDGKHLVSGSQDEVLRIWDTASGDIERVIEGHADMVHCVAWSPDGKQLVSGSYDRTFRTWDAERGVQTGCFRSHGSPVKAAAYAGIDNLIVTEDTYRVIVSDALTGREQSRLEKTHRQGVIAIAKRPFQIAIVEGLSVLVWEPQTRKQRSFVTDSASSLCAAFAQSPDRIFAGCSDGAIRGWDLKSGHLVVQAAIHDRPILHIAIDESGQIITSDSETVRITMSGSLVGSGLIEGHAGNIRDAAFCAKGDVLAAVSEKGRIDIFLDVSVIREHFWFDLENRGASAWHIALSPDGSLLAVGGTRVFLVESRTGRKVREMRDLKCGLVNRLVFSPDGHYLLVGVGPGIWLWNLRTDEVRVWAKHGSEMLAYSADGKRVLCGSSGPMVCDAESGRVLAECSTEKTRGVNARSYIDGAFCADGTSVALRWKSPFLRDLDLEGMRIWNFATGDQQQVFLGRSDVSAVGHPMRHRFRAVVLDAETQIEETASNRVVGWYPGNLETIKASPANDIWAGTAGMRLHLFGIETY